jgi:polar amino acid transport system substrate-binding protein
MPNMPPTVVTDLAPGGVLRAAINLGNPVLAQGTPMEPAGVTVDISREIATRLNVQVKFVSFTAARESFEAMMAGQADICFLAIEPAREAEVAFTAPYVLIEGVFAVPGPSRLATVGDVDSAGVRIGVTRGSAYDLFLSRTLQHATVVRGADGTGEFLAQNLEASAGIREAMTAFVASHSGLRLIDERFMEIRQAVGTAKTKSAETTSFLHGLVEELKATGFIADSLRRAGQSAAVAPAG